MNGPVGKGGSAIMTVSMSQSHTQKAMLRKSRRRRKKRRECPDIGDLPGETNFSEDDEFKNSAAIAFLSGISPEPDDRCRRLRSRLPVLGCAIRPCGVPKM